ncbi:MAG: hypothetical protein ACOY0T_32075 [Myxococcota bacterium]
MSLCLEVKTDVVANQAGFEKLVRSELARHPSHHVVEASCDSRLLVELFELGKSRFLTVRIDGEIPLRYTLSSERELEVRLAEGISRVLRNDPAYLAEAPTRLSSGERAVRAVLVHGVNNYRLAFFEAIARTDTGMAFAPGVGFELARSGGHFGIFVRTALAYSPPGVRGDQRSLNLLGQAEAGLTYEWWPRRGWTPYAGLSAGALALRFEGRVDPRDPNSQDGVMTTGAMLGARVGVRLLRLYDFDCDAFATLVAPLFATRNPDAELFGERGVYTPLAQLGLGVGF